VWFSSHESSQDSIHTLIKHKDFISCILLSPILSNHIDLFQLSSQIHILQSTIILPYLSYHNISISLNIKQTLFFCLSCLNVFVLYDYVVLFMCYSLYEELCA
jgi:hypothetical protein